MSLSTFLRGALAAPRANPGPLRIVTRRAPDALAPDSVLLTAWVTGRRHTTGIDVVVGPADAIHLGSGRRMRNAKAARDRRRWAFVIGMRVDDDLRGLGVGGALLDRAAAMARAEGAEGLGLDAAASAGRGALSQFDLIEFYRGAF